MIPLLDASAATEVRLPLWSDPAIVKANSAEALQHFVATGDASELNVPGMATLVVIKALSARELESCAPGRRPHFGAVVNERKRQARMAAGDISTSEGAAAFAKWRDGLTDEEDAALERFEAWEAERFRVIAHAGCVDVEQPDGWHFTFDDFMERISNPNLKAAIAHEIGFRVQALSGLGDRPKGLPDSASGSERPSGPVGERGDVTSAPSDCGASEATAAALSPTG